MNTYEWIGFLGFILLVVYQTKLWCNIYCTCGVVGNGLRVSLKEVWNE